MGAFTIQWSTRPGPEASATVLLDPLQRYLDDHRPGGEPLLGTVMGLEIMAELAVGLSPGMMLQSFEAVEIVQPYIARGHGPFHVAAAVMRGHSAAETQRMGCILYSRGPGADATRHFKTQVRVGRGPLPLTRREIFSARSVALPALLSRISAVNPEMFAVFTFVNVVPSE